MGNFPWVDLRRVCRKVLALASAEGGLQDWPRSLRIHGDGQRAFHAWFRCLAGSRPWPYALRMGLEELLDRAKRLPANERRELAERLLADLDRSSEAAPTLEERLKALDRFLELAGTAHLADSPAE